MASLANNDNSPFRAFPSHADPAHYFPAETTEVARKRLTMSLTRGEGVALLIGSPGCGKTMMLEVLAKELESTLRVVRLASTQICTRRALLQAILFGLGEPYEDLEEGELRLSLVKYIEDQLPPIALFVDEAQSLPLRLLEELRLLSNISAGGEPKLRLLLAGAASLDELLTAPELDAFNQRITTRSYLTPLGHEETTQYVRSHVASAGGDPEILFHADAYAAIYQASDGLPRLINQVCDRALVLAVEGESEIITAEAIQNAWSDLHQLPAPWHAPQQAALAARTSDDQEATEENTSVVEFGSLDDELNDLDDFDALEPASPEAKSADQSEVEGVWNADAAFDNISTQIATAEPADAVAEEYELALEDEAEVATSTSDEEEFVSLAFPVDKVTQEIVTPVEDEIAATIDVTPEAVNDSFESELVIDEDDLICHDDTTELDELDDEEEEEVPLANDPFDEPFEEEEEVVLDRCRGLEAVIRHDAQTVTNLQDISFGLMFQALTPAVENLLDDVRSRIDGPVIGGGLSLVADPSLLVEEDPFADLELVSIAKSPQAGVYLEPEEEEFVSPSYDDSDILIIEDEEPIGKSEVVRREYSQLFAGLRQR